MKLTITELAYLCEALSSEISCTSESYPLVCGILKKMSTEIARKNEKKRKAEADVLFAPHPTEGG